jgi:hypothetical protein
MLSPHQVMAQRVVQIRRDAARLYFLAIVCALLGSSLVMCQRRCSDRILDVSSAIDVVELVVETKSGELLWKVTANGKPLSVVRYGVVPPNAEQVYPKDRAETPRVDERCDRTSVLADRILFHPWDRQ